jgi:hypothetical protein
VPAPAINQDPAGVAAAQDDPRQDRVDPGSAATAAAGDLQRLQDFRKQWQSLSRPQKEQYVRRLTPDQLKQVMDIDKATMMPGLTMSANPPLWSAAGIKKEGYDLLGKALQALPSIGSMAGAWGGGVAGAGIGASVGGPAGAPLGETAGQLTGATLGGGAGEAARQGVEHLLGWDKYDDYSARQRWRDIGLESVYNGLGELMGMGAGRAIAPGGERGLQRVESKLVFAGGFEHGTDPLGASSTSVILPDLIQLEKRYPVHDTKDLANLVTQLKRETGQQVDAAYAQPIMQGGRRIPLGKAMANTTDIVQRLDGVLSNLRINPDINAAAIRQVEKIRTLAMTPRTYEQLADWRISINREIGAFYELNPGAKSIAMSTNPDLAAKKEVADAIRDITYPEMDRAMGAPGGTTAVLQKKRGIAMDMENQVLQHRKNLLTASSRARGESPLKRGNASIYVTGSGRPGGALHKVKSIFHAPDVMSDADKRAASAFGNTWPQKVARGVTHPAVMRTVTRLPGYAMTPDTQRPTEEEEPAEQPPQQPSQTQLKAEAAQRRPAPAQRARSYKLTAHSASGHQIGSDDGATWFDVQTGQRVQ